MVEAFGRTENGSEVKLYTIKNTSGMQVKISDYGACVVSLFVRDRYGNARDVSLGYDNVYDYENNTYYFGAIIGRNSNRIANGQFFCIQMQQWLWL